MLDKENTNPAIFHEASFLKDHSVLYEYLNGIDHLHFIAATQKLPKERVEEVIDLLEIRPYVKRKVREYSLGMKQHLLFAMALLNKPKLMIMDEPLNGLDPTSVVRVRKLLKDLVKEGTTILISSHTLAEIDKLTDKIYFLKDGTILEDPYKGESMSSEEKYMKIFGEKSLKTG